MKKILTLVIVLVIIGAAVWKYNSSEPVVPKLETAYEQSTTTIPTSQTVKVSEKLLEYKNEELGFSIKYPSEWQKTEQPATVTFSVIASADKLKNSIDAIQSKIDVTSGSCAFPAVTKIASRDTLKVGNLSYSMITISNTLQGRNYYNRMYSLQKDSLCYFFTFSSITLSPSSKGFTGAEAQKIGAQNKVIVDTADNQFKDMVKSFKFVTGPEGKDESTVSPQNK